MDRFKTPSLVPGGTYLTFTSDDLMRRVYVSPSCVEQDRNGDWTAILPDATLGARRVKEGDRLFSFYARVQTPVLDRDNPVILEEGDLFSQASEEREMLEQQKQLDNKRRLLRVARMSAGGTR